MLDADETLEDTLLQSMKQIIESNSKIDMFLVPRINTIIDLDKRPDLVMKYGWQVNQQGWINYPDAQTRLFRNKPEIRWSGKVHERINGHKIYAFLEGMHILHEKDWLRQTSQNDFYSRLQV